ncbi:MAG: hypothetical protein A3A85_06980 [Deltaproteobacteria bacterium RIFCSPLOWO2_01_FULL_42_9]|nr:MAG: hypothetical protein A3A85_06980 [Deltaproteobacteria bacterium RIFCSPLOWO2_01_FULL_42_9]
MTKETFKEKLSSLVQKFEKDKQHYGKGDRFILRGKRRAEKDRKAQKGIRFIFGERGKGCNP